jgi:hypothetical protein
MHFNPRVSAYWLWLAVIGGILSVVPTECISVSWLYFNGALSGYNDPYPTMNTAGWIVLHAALSTALAVVATAIHRALAKATQPDYPPESKTFTLGGLLWLIAVAACVFSLLASLGAIPAVYVVVLICIAGRGVVLLLASVGW